MKKLPPYWFSSYVYFRGGNRPVTWQGRLVWIIYALIFPLALFLLWPAHGHEASNSWAMGMLLIPLNILLLLIICYFKSPPKQLEK